MYTIPDHILNLLVKYPSDRWLKHNLSCSLLESTATQKRSSKVVNAIFQDTLRSQIGLLYAWAKQTKGSKARQVTPGQVEFGYSYYEMCVAPQEEFERIKARSKLGSARTYHAWYQFSVAEVLKDRYGPEVGQAWELCIDMTISKATEQAYGYARIDGGSHQGPDTVGARMNFDAEYKPLESALIYRAQKAYPKLRQAEPGDFGVHFNYQAVRSDRILPPPHPVALTRSFYERFPRDRRN